MKEIYPKYEELDDKQKAKLGNLTCIMCFTRKYTFPPIAAFLGGVVSQEIVKAITQKYSPIHQFFYYDCAELFPEQDIMSLNEERKSKLFNPAIDY